MELGLGLNINLPAVGGGFSPLDYSPTWWADASDASTIVLDGVGVSQMNDKSGNGNYFVRGSDVDDPTYLEGEQKGLNVINFNGSDQFLRCVNNFVNSFSDTWFFALQTDQDGPNNATFFNDYGDSGNKILLIRSDNDGTQRVYYVRDGTGASLSIIDSLTEAYSFMILTRIGGSPDGTITMNYNGNIQSLTNPYADTTYSGGNVPHLGVQGGSTLGSPNQAGTYFKGHFCEGGRFPGVLNANQREKLAIYLADKWI
jgi:hypothetical protein